MDVLLDKTVGLPDVLLRTNIEKLTLLPAGMPHKNATELLASGAMKKLLVAVSGPSRAIDTAPASVKPCVASIYQLDALVRRAPALQLTTDARNTPSHEGALA